MLHVFEGNGILWGKEHIWKGSCLRYYVYRKIIAVKIVFVWGEIKGTAALSRAGKWLRKT